MEQLTYLLPYAAFGLSLFSTLQSRFMSRENAKRDERLGVIEKQVTLFWRMVEQHMTTVLHSPHTPEMDVLLERYQAEGIELSPEEAKELSERLLNLINDPTESKGSRSSAVLLLTALINRGSEAMSLNNPGIDKPA